MCVGANKIKENDKKINKRINKIFVNETSFKKIVLYFFQKVV